MSPSSVLVPSAPGFRTATLWTTSSGSGSGSGDDELEKFRARFATDIELIEPDFTMTAFQNPVVSQNPASPPA